MKGSDLRVALRQVVARCLLVTALAATAACADQPTSPTREVFPLPSDAPGDAAAPVGATRVLITAIQIFTPDGRLADPRAVQGNTRFGGVDRFKAWIFCPRGMEGSFEFRYSSSSGYLQLHPGYNVVEGNVFIAPTPGLFVFRLDVIREFVIIASKELPLVVVP